MSRDEFLRLIIPLFSALFGGLVVALINHYLTREKARAEINKLEAETEKIRAEAESIVRAVEGVKSEQNVQEGAIKEIQKSQEEIVRNLVAFSMSGFIFGQLEKIYHAQKEGRAYRFDNNSIFKRELQFLEDSGYIEHINVEELRAGDNLAEMVRITPAGEWYVQLREGLERNK